MKTKIHKEDMTMTKVVLYAFDNLFKVKDVRFVNENEATETVLRDIAQAIVDNSPAIINAVYAIKDRAGLREDFMEAVKGDFTDKILFEDMVSREGICLTA